MAEAVLGIIGGSGIYDLPGLENACDEVVASPWGEPSAPLRRWTRSAGHCAPSVTVTWMLRHV